jgi:HAD superfamily hydrolase (TIGR01662 family)
MSRSIPTTVVIPTIGRESLRTLLDALAGMPGPQPAAIVVVDDRREGRRSDLGLPSSMAYVWSGGLGPAAARKRGWRHARTPWVSFLDDDVVPTTSWAEQLAADLDGLAPDVGGSQGRVVVPLPSGRAPTDFERSTAGLADARWITADMSYRADLLWAVGGFDERFRRAYREDSDLALRVMDTGARLVRGTRTVTHPVRAEGGWVSVRQQRGNADDVLMSRLHDSSWRGRAGAARGRRTRHVGVTACAAGAVAAVLSRRPGVAAMAAAAWLLGTAELAVARIAPGPRDRLEVRRMLASSAVIPPVATYWWVAGLVRHRAVPAWQPVPELVLFDRDGTLVHDVPYNGDPRLVRAVEGATDALGVLRAAGIKTGVVTNQSGVGDGRITADQAESVNARVEALLGPFDVWMTCMHGRDAGCGCRKPAPGMVRDACRMLGVPPERCVVVGDTAADVAAADAAGASGVLVPNAATRSAEVAQAPRVSGDLRSAIITLGGALR